MVDTTMTVTVDLQTDELTRALMDSEQTPSGVEPTTNLLVHALESRGEGGTDIVDVLTEYLEAEPALQFTDEQEHLIVELIWDAYNNR